LATGHGAGGDQEGIGLSEGDFGMDLMGIPGRIIWEYKIRVLYGEVSWGYLDSGDRIANNQESGQYAVQKLQLS